MAVFSATQCASGAPIPRFPLRFSLITSLFFEIDQGYLYVFSGCNVYVPVFKAKSKCRFQTTGGKAQKHFQRFLCSGPFFTYIVSLCYVDIPDSVFMLKFDFTEFFQI